MHNNRNLLPGCDHLSVDGAGFVYWRDIRVEHFSFDSVENERGAAQRLAAACMYIEDQGREVSLIAVDAVWRRLQLAQDTSHAKYLFSWTIGGNPKECVRVIELTSHQDLDVFKKQIDFGIQSFTKVNEDWASRHKAACRSLVIATQESYYAAVNNIEDDIDWLSRYGTAADKYGAPMHRIRLLSHLQRQIDINALPTTEFVEEFVLGEYLDLVRAEIESEVLTSESTSVEVLRSC